MAKHEPIDDRYDAQEDTVEAPDGQVPGPRRAAPGRLRSLPSAAALPDLLPGEDTPRVAELHALLGDIDALRLTLQTDLTLAAAALEGGARDLAAELVDGDLSELQAFSRRAADHLSRLDRAAASDEVAPPDELPVQIPVRRRRVLSGAPLMAAAAALIGFVAFLPSRGAATPPEPTMTSAAMAGYELTRLASAGAPDEQLRRAAQELNDELAALIARAGDDPVAAQQALLLLEQTTQVLADQGDSGVLRSVIAETQALRARLREALPVVAQRPVRAVVRPVRPVVRVVTPQAPRILVEPEKERSSSSPSGQTSPQPSPTPSPSSPPPAPAPAPSPSPSPEPTAEESPSGDGQPPGPFGASDLPGF